MNRQTYVVRRSRALQTLLVSVTACVLLLGCSEEDDGRDDARFLGITSADYAFTLDVRALSDADSNSSFISERVFDNEMRKWHIQRTVIEAPDVFEFVLFNTRSIGEDGTHYGCAFRGYGNPVNATVEEGFCLLEGSQPGDFLRLEITEPAEVNIHDRDTGQLLLDHMRMERVRNGWQRMRGEGRISMRSGFSFGLSTGALPNVDSDNPPNPPRRTCDARPFCIQTENADARVLISEPSLPAICQSWLATRVDSDAHFELGEGGWLSSTVLSSPYALIEDGLSCDYLGYSGALNTRQDAVIDMENQMLTLTLREYVLGDETGVQTVFCEGEWTYPWTRVNCP